MTITRNKETPMSNDYTTELETMVKYYAEELNAVINGQIFASDPTDSDTWIYKNDDSLEKVSVLDWANQCLEVTIKGEKNPYEGKFTPISVDVLLTIGGPYIVARGEENSVFGFWGSETAVAYVPNLNDILLEWFVS